MVEFDGRKGILNALLNTLRFRRISGDPPLFKPSKPFLIYCHTASWFHRTSFRRTCAVFEFVSTNSGNFLHTVWQYTALLPRKMTSAFP